MDIFLAAFLPLSLVIIMFSLGLGLRIDDFRRILHYPKAFAIGVAAQLAILPATAFVIAIVMGLSAPLAVGLMILSFCPGGATSNMLTKLSHGDLALSISLTGVMSLVTVFTLPVLLKFAVDYFMGVDAPPIDVAGIGIALFLLTTVPVIIGIAIRHRYDAFASRVDRPVARMAFTLFVIVVVGALAINWNVFVSNLSVLGPSVILLNVAMLGIGLGLAQLFSLGRAEATAIALETGIQNAALGITVGTLFVEQVVGLPPFSLPAGVYAIIMYLISVPFTLWRRSMASV
jgi:bile acid:Na+ symporter, BASS family